MLLFAAERLSLTGRGDHIQPLNLIFTMESSTFIDAVTNYAAMPRRPNV